MVSVLRDFLRKESGQDMVEYALLLAFVVLCSGALLLHNAEAVAGIWQTTDGNLEKANSIARR